MVRSGILYFVSLIVGAVFFVPMALAAQGPEDVLKELMDKIKAKSDPSPVVDYVSWEQAYEAVPQQQKKAMKVSSPQEMKTFYRKMLTSPSTMMKEQFVANMAKMPPEKKAMMQQSMSQFEQMLQKKEKEMKERIAGTNYEIGKTKIDGDTATVMLKQTYKEEVREEEVKFVKSGGKWMLPSVGLMKPKSSNPPRAK